ncbi:MAG: ABC transporter permease [Candidatus Diapherotrites archaeon]|uniref:ABC transporter permease n=1 Tax=Candidatus Iainarchaeum sp. TaxID=3101447 RepID=A0A8T4L463_9ARCH|nr:ABC transporter permease [Candidatus Diapherotrites archaeon]
MLKNLATLAYREVLILTKIKARVIGLVVNALLWLIALGFGLNPVVSISGFSYFAFLVPGMIGINLLFPSFFGASTLITDRQFGFFKELKIAPIKRYVVILGKALGLTVYASFSALILLAISFLLGFQLSNPIIQIPQILGLIVLSSLGLTCLGLAIAARFYDTQSFQLMGNFIVFPFFLLSGAFFPLDKAPWFIQAFSYINPITYGIDALRAVSLGISHLPLILDLAILAGFTIATLLLAAWLFNKSE